MINKKQPYFKEWERATINLTQHFVDRYFGRNTEACWVAEEVGVVANIGDYFFNVGDMVDFLRYNYTRKAMFEYYEYDLKCLENKESPINIKAWRHLKK